MGFHYTRICFCGRLKISKYKLKNSVLISATYLEMQTNNRLQLMDGWMGNGERQIWECNKMSMVESGWWVCGCTVLFTFLYVWKFS